VIRNLAASGRAWARAYVAPLQVGAILRREGLPDAEVKMPIVPQACDQKGTLRGFLASASDTSQLSPTLSSTIVSRTQETAQQQMSDGGCHAQ